MIKTLYWSIGSLLKVNGGLCVSFTFHRGIRQGCCLSGMLYRIIIEPLLCCIRAKLQGVQIAPSIPRDHLSANSDDVLIIINSQMEVDQLSSILRQFKAVTPAKVNWVESSTLLMGDHRISSSRWVGLGVVSVVWVCFWETKQCRRTGRVC